MKLALSHPTGNANLRAVLEAVDDAGILDRFYTCLAVDPSSTWLKLLPSALSTELLRRSFPVRPEKIKSFPLREVGRLFAQKAGLTTLTRHELGALSVDRIYQNHDSRVAAALEGRVGLNSVYAYEDGALKTFTKAGEMGLARFYDLPIGYWKAGREILEAEKIRRPDWAATLTGLRDSDEKLERKDQEIAMADQIFVASSFTASTLENKELKKESIRIIPYGFPEIARGREYSANENRPLKLLFVGGLSQRKGIAEIFEVVERFGRNVELTIVGRKPSDECKALNEALGKHHYIPALPHHGILDLMRRSDVLLFPSHFEGFGLVITEAMSQGTPVITTERTCGPDLIEHGKDGWIIKAGDKDALFQAIENLIGHRGLAVEAGKAAMIKAASRPWSSYGEELVNAILSFGK